MVKIEQEYNDLIERSAVLAQELYAIELLSHADSIADEKSSTKIDQQSLSTAYDTGKVVIKNPTVKKSICAALISTGNDFKDVAKIIAAALLPLSLAGVIALPLTPLAFAATAILVYRMGTEAYCSTEN